MATTQPPISLSKRVQALTPEQEGKLVKLSKLSFETFNESDIREEYLVPIIDLLGYERSSDYTVLRETSFALHPLFLQVGSSRIKLDYRFNVYKSGFWLLEAKSGKCQDPSQPPPLNDDAIEQAHFYAHHREIDCPLFGVSNGWWLNIYDRDAEDPLKPVLAIPHTELASRFGELNALIGASQVTFAIKRKLLDRIEQVLSADVDLERPEEFVRAVEAVARRAYPKALENFRRNAKVQQDANNKEFEEYLQSGRPEQLIDTLFLWPMNMGHISKASHILSQRVAKYAGSNQFMFFHKLMLEEPRVVTIDYYINALHLLGQLHHKGELEFVDRRGSGTATTPITDFYIEFVRLVLFRFKDRPDLRLMWAMEGLLKRMTKRALLSNETARKDIAAGVEFQRYFDSEEKIAYMGPSPARTLVQAVESISLTELGRFFDRHYEPKNRKFNEAAASREFQTRRKAFEPLENATDAAYQELSKSLGQEWSELTWSDHLNRSWDRLGAAVCEQVLGFKKLLPLLPQDCRDQLVELGRLGNSFARDAATELGLEVGPQYPDSAARMQAIFTLSG